MAEQVRTAHLLIKHTGSRNPVSRRTGAQVTLSPDQALAELQSYEARINSEGVTNAFPKYGTSNDCNDQIDYLWYVTESNLAPTLFLGIFQYRLLPKSCWKKRLFLLQEQWRLGIFWSRDDAKAFRGCKLWIEHWRNVKHCEHRLWISFNLQDSLDSDQQIGWIATFISNASSQIRRRSELKSRLAADVSLENHLTWYLHITFRLYRFLILQFIRWQSSTCPNLTIIHNISALTTWGSRSLGFSI